MSNLPFKIERNNVLGRHVIATRDIHPGEIIAENFPLILAPKMASAPLCLGCHKKLDLVVTRYDCTICKWPLCSKSCENSPLHKEECQLFANSKYQPAVKNDNTKQSVYCSIAPLRALLLKQNSPDDFKRLLECQSHLEDHQKTQIYQILKQNLVPFFTRILKLDTNETEILTICSIFDTNCFDVRDHKGLVNVRGLYPNIALLSHDCRHNTKHSFHGDNFRLVLTATSLIKEGEMITTTYTQTLWGTLARRSHLKMAKRFECECDRCKDPTEFGSYVGAINCSVCGDGSKVISCNSLNSEADWQCEKCGYLISGAEMIWGDEVLRKEISELDKTDPRSLEEFLERYSEVLHEKISYCLQVKYALTQMYGTLEGFKLNGELRKI